MASFALPPGSMHSVPKRDGLFRYRGTYLQLAYFKFLLRPKVGHNLIEVLVSVDVTRIPYGAEFNNNDLSEVKQKAAGRLPIGHATESYRLKSLPPHDRIKARSILPAEQWA